MLDQGNEPAERNARLFYLDEIIGRGAHEKGRPDRESVSAQKVTK